MPHTYASTSICRRRALLAALAPLLPHTARGQATVYPEKPIGLIVPFVPGGATDVVARLIGPPLASRMGQGVIVDNRAGAAGTIGWSHAARAQPDGYTLLVHDLSLAIVGSLRTKLPFDPRKDFTPIMTVATVPHVLVVSATVPARNVAELIALAKGQPGTLFFGSGGTGTNPHIGGELFKSVAKIDIAHIPYKGGAGAMPDLIAGQIQIMVSSAPAVLPHIRSGRIRPLMVTSATRLAALPDVPSAVEAGLPSMEMLFWAGLAAPAHTPQSIRDRLHAELRDILATNDTKERFAQAGLDLRVDSQAQAQALLQSEISRWSALVKRAGITAG